MSTSGGNLTANTVVVTGFNGQTTALIDAVTFGGVHVMRAMGDNKVGFFNHAPVAQVATPVTLADVITLLQSYGLSA